MKYLVSAVVLAMLAGFAFSSGGAQADRDACVSQIEATNNAAGVATDYQGAYRTCRAR